MMCNSSVRFNPYVLPHTSQEKGLSPKCIELLWSFKLALSLNILLQVSQTNSVFGSWTKCKCFTNCFFSTKLSLHLSHVNDFNLRWTCLTWVSRADFVAKAFAHVSQLKGLILKWTVFLWWRYSLIDLIPRSHSSHWNGFSFWCLNLVCIFKSFSRTNLASHSTHVWGLFITWTWFMCRTRLCFLSNFLSHSSQ